MFDDPDTTGAAAAADQPPETGQEDPPLPAEAQAAADEEEAAWNEVLAEATGDDPPAPEGESDEEEPEAPAAEASAEGEDPEDPAGEAGTEGQPAEGKEGAEEAAAQAAAPADPDPDAEIDWGTVDPKVRAAYEAEARRAARAEHAFKSREGREAALQRKLDAVMAGDKEGEDPAKEKPADQPPAVTQADVETFQEEWKEFDSNYPEISKPLGKLAGFHNRRFTSVEERIAALEQGQERQQIGMQQIAEDRQAAAVDAAEQQVLEAHPDVDDIAGTDDFKAWVETQPGPIQAIAEANGEELIDAGGVNRLLDLYKLDKGIAVNGARNGASTAEPEPGADTKSAAEPEPGAQKPAATSARREIQRRSASAPAPSPGAPAREDDPMQGETEDDVWAQILTAEKRKQAAEARA